LNIVARDQLSTHGAKALQDSLVMPISEW
jgi:hypothetical protein